MLLSHESFRSCLNASPFLGPLAMPLFLEKLNAGTNHIKVILIISTQYPLTLSTDRYPTNHRCVFARLWTGRLSGAFRKIMEWA